MRKGKVVEVAQSHLDRRFGDIAADCPVHLVRQSDARKQMVFLRAALRSISIVRRKGVPKCGCGLADQSSPRRDKPGGGGVECGNLRMTMDELQDSAVAVLEELNQDYPNLTFDVQKFIIQMPQL